MRNSEELEIEISELENEIDSLVDVLEDKERELSNMEVDPDDYEDEYCQLIDEEGPVKIGSLEYPASMVLREIDPTAYRCGLIDYADDMDISESLDYQRLEDEIKNLKDQINSLEEDKEELENELEDLED